MSADPGPTRPLILEEPSYGEQPERVLPPVTPPTVPRPDGGGLRYNSGKNRMELVPPEWEWALADVTTQGSKKYAARNWERGMDWSNMVGCMKRHLAKFLAGERYDGSELNIEKGTTGCHHLAMVAWNALALMSYDLRGIGNNDLPQLQAMLLTAVNAMGTAGPEKEQR
jgi:hypothetical protein